MAKDKSNTSALGKISEKFSNYKDGYYFPTDDIDPNKKDEGWHLAWSQAIWSLFINGGTFNTIDEYSQIELMRLYGAGRQPNGIYQDLLLLPQDINPERTGWLSTNWEIFSPAPKLHREIRGKFEQQEYDFIATTLDPTSTLKKEQKQWDIWFNSQYGQIEKEIQAMVGLEGDDKEEDKYIAQSLDELNMFREMGGIKLNEEAAIEVALDATDAVSDVLTIKEKCISDLIDIGKTAFRDFYNTYTKRVEYEYVDWQYLIIDYSKEKNFKDIRFWSYIKFATINDVRAKTNLSETELIDICKANCGYWGNMSMDAFSRYSGLNYCNQQGVRIYDQFRIPISVSEWVSTDTNYKLKKVTKNGGNKYFEQEWGKVYDTKKEKTKINTVNNVYQCSWIMGSKHIYDYGLSLNTARPNPKEPRLSIHAVHIPGKSLTETCKPVYDQIELAWLRYQSAIAQAAPAGMDIDISALEDIQVGNKKMNVLDLIMLKRQTGDTLRRSTELSSRYGQQGRPINRNEGGVGTYLDEILKTLDVNFNYIRFLTGVDLVQQQPNLTATETQYRANLTGDALQPLWTSWVKAREDAAQTAAIKIARAIKYDDEAKETYTAMIGKAQTELLSIISQTTPIEIGIKIEQRPTQEMKQAAIKAATEAMKPGKDGSSITLPDWWYFVDMINRGRPKHAMAILKYRLQKEAEKSMAMQQENMQQNRQTALMTQKMKNDGEIQKVAMEGDIELKVEAEKALLQMEVTGHETLNELKQQLLLKILMPEQNQQVAQQPQVPQEQVTEEQVSQQIVQ